MSTTTSTNSIPYVKCFDNENESFKLTITQETNILHIHLTKLELDDYCWENRYEIEQLIKTDRNWNIYEDYEIPLVIGDCISSNNYKLVFEKDSLRVKFWNKLICGAKEKTLDYYLDLNKAKIDKESIIESILHNIKRNNESNVNINVKLKDYENKVNEIHSQTNDQLNILKENIAKNEETVSSIKVKLFDHIEKTNDYFDHLLRKIEETNAKLQSLEVNAVKSSQVKWSPCAYSFSKKNTINVLHFTNFDCYSPTKESLQNEANILGVNLNIVENRGLELNSNLLNGIDTVLVSTWSKVDREKLGNILAEFVEKKGGNLVIVLFANCTKHASPTGKLNEITPLIPKESDSKHQSYDILMPQHLLFDGSPSISPGSHKSRAIVEVNKVGTIELVAKWSDGVPMIATRTDMKGLITSIGFQCGSVGSQDGIRVLANAIRMSK